MGDLFKVPRHFLFNTGLRKWAYNLSRFNQYGLHKDDVRYEDEVVTEALKRIPKHVRDERAFRLVRAMQLCAQKTVLPKEQWVKFEEDNPYLTPYIEEVERELKEKDDWDRI